MYMILHRYRECSKHFLAVLPGQFAWGSRHLAQEAADCKLHDMGLRKLAKE